jgi:hypothetical protein
VEESAITSKQDRHRAEESALPTCGSCRKVGHSSNKCFARQKREARLKRIVTNASKLVVVLLVLVRGEGPPSKTLSKTTKKGREFREHKSRRETT